MNETHITEVSNPRDLTIDDPATKAMQDIKIVKGRPPVE